MMLRVSVVDDDDALRESIVELLVAEGYVVRAYGSAESFLTSEEETDCAIVDVHMPGLTGLELQAKLNEMSRRIAMIFLTAHGDIPSSVQAIKAGALDYFLKPFVPDELLASVAHAVERRSSKQDRLGAGIIGSSGTLRRVLDEVELVASTDATVLVHGETGTGKELIAQAIHVLSGRTGPLVRVNCAAVPAALLESELMGHEKGAFTGALARRIGRFEAAQHGTIFLDEIGELPLDLQPKILRILQERAFERVGGSETITCDVRVIAATHRDLRAMVDERAFRADLFYRLDVFPIELPPLRDRAEDIPTLARHFADQCARRMKRDAPRIPPEFIERLGHHSWPGNIRELINVIERCTILATDGTLSVRSLGRLEARAVAKAPALSRRSRGDDDRLESVDRSHILAVLEATNWVVGGARGAAARLGIKRPTLLYRMKKLGIERDPR